MGPGVLVDAIQQVGYQASYSMEELPSSLGGKFILQVHEPLHHSSLSLGGHVFVCACVRVVFLCSSFFYNSSLTEPFAVPFPDWRHVVRLVLLDREKRPAEGSRRRESSCQYHDPESSW